MITSELNTKDFSDRVLGGKYYSSDPSSRLVENQELGRVQVKDDTGNVVSEIGLIGANRFGMQSLDSDGNAVIFSGKDGDFYGTKVSKEGTDVFIEDNVVISTNKMPLRIRLQNYFSQPHIPFVGDQIVVPRESFINYNSASNNDVVRLPLYINDDIEVVSGTVKAFFFDHIEFVGTSRLEDVAIMLNPDTTEEVGGSATFKRFENGEAIISGYNPTKDKDDISVELSTDQIDAINNGWNEFVVQQNLSNVTNSKAGYAVISIIIDCYKYFS